MTVQPSVTIWTILCFLGLMLILDRLLFRPLLQFMDQRQKKIDSARETRAVMLAQREEELRSREETRLAEEKRLLQEANDEVAALTQEYKRILAEKKADNQRRLAEQRAALTEESGAMLRELQAHIVSTSAAFTDRIESWRDWEGSISDEEETAAPHLETGPAKLSFLDQEAT